MIIPVPHTRTRTREVTFVRYWDVMYGRVYVATVIREVAEDEAMKNVTNYGY